MFGLHNKLWNEEGVTLLTKIIGNFVCSICKHPEEDSFSATGRLASSIHPGCYEYSTSLYALHEHVTCNRQVLPVTQQNSVLSEIWRDPRFHTVDVL